MDLKAKLEESLAHVWVETNNEIVQKIIANTFLWTWAITAIVFAVGYYMVYLIKTGAINPGQYTIAFWASAILGLILVFAISWFYEKFNYKTLAVLALLFAVAEGVWLGGILSVYSAASVINAFAAAAVVFVWMAIYGYTTKTDLTKLWVILFWWLIWLIVLSLINVFFVHSSGLDLWLSILWLLIFMWLVAWDLQMLKMMASTGDRRFDIVFAISLYLDFINIFLEILKLIGKSDD
jgi:FtsH-binding integral membrane protein